MPDTFAPNSANREITHAQTSYYLRIVAVTSTMTLRLDVGSVDSETRIGLPLSSNGSNLRVVPRPSCCDVGDRYSMISS